MKRCSLNSIILDARANLNKTFIDLIWDQFYCYNVSGKEEEAKLKELIYDARQDREFDYMSVAERNGILERKIVLVGVDPKIKRPEFIAYDGGDTALVGYRGKKTLESGFVYSPYIPIQRGEFAKFVAEDLVSVQPMSEPCGFSSAVDYDVPEVELTLKSKTIVSKPLKLKCKWSLEQMADLSTTFGIPNEKAITERWALDIRHEIDKEIIESLKTFAEKANRNSAAMNLYSNKLVANPFLETSTLKQNNMFSSSSSVRDSIEIPF